MKHLPNKEWLAVIFILIVGICIRSIYFTEHLNFSTDQASFATESLEIWQNKEVRLIGPSISFKTFGREVFQGSLTYYFQLLFLVPAQFEPVMTSYLFMLFAMSMMIPLYIGAKLLINRNVAFIVISTFALLPMYIYHTRFLWNPNFQLSLTPILLLLMGLFSVTGKQRYFYIISIFAGIQLLFHYQYIVVMLGLLIYYFVYKRLGFQYLMIYFFGILVGFSPIILFEIRNQFYNTQTVLLYFSNISGIFSLGPRSALNTHYILSISLFAYVVFLASIQKLVRPKHVIALFILLFILASERYIMQKPSGAFGMAKNWNIQYEKQVFDIVTSQNVSNYNVINLGYDTVATVQKYLMKTNGVVINYDDYYTNEYLFVITKDIDYMNDPAYEINTFKPSIIVREWEINPTYKLILLQRNPPIDLVETTGV